MKKKLTIGLILISSSILAMSQIKKDTVLGRMLREKGLAEKQTSRILRSGCEVYEDPSGNEFLFVPPVYEDAGLHPINTERSSTAEKE